NNPQNWLIALHGAVLDIFPTPCGNFEPALPISERFPYMQRSHGKVGPIPHSVPTHYHESTSERLALSVNYPAIDFI
ncbi:MAG TPA: hypothetical protein VGC21_05450, partial [Telluria sp.]